MFVSERMQLRSHVGTQPVKRFRRDKVYAICLWYCIRFGMLQVRENEISLFHWPGGAAHSHVRGIIVGAQSQFIRPPSMTCQADVLQSRGEMNAG